MSVKGYDRFCNFVFICQGKDCKKKGAKGLYKKFSADIKAKGLKQKTRVIKTKCTDRCKEAPAIIIKDHWLGKVKEAQVPDLINQYFEKE